MVQFKPTPSQENYSAPLEEDSGIEQPIIPLSQLGTTVIETDPRTGAHILQNIEANIRKGASTMQLVWSTDSKAAIGGRPKAYGKDVRQAIKEMLIANEVNLVGMEMPTSSNTNVSGFDPQQGTISEEKRQRDLQEIRDAIDFQVEVAGGGGVDVWSQEFMRDITDARWNTDKKSRFYDSAQEELGFRDRVDAYVRGEGEKPEHDANIDRVKHLYDDRTGAIINSIKTSSTFHTPKYMNAGDIDKEYNKNTTLRFVGRVDDNKKAALGGDGKIDPGDMVDLAGNWLNPNKIEDTINRVPVWNEKKKQFESEELSWGDMVKQANDYNQKNNLKLGDAEYRTPEKQAFNIQMEPQILQMRGQSLFYSRGYADQRDQVLRMQEKKEEFSKRATDLRKYFPNDEDYEFALTEEAKKYATIFTGRKADQFEVDAVTTEIVHGKEAFFDKQIQDAQHGLKHTHEASASADAQASDREDMRKHVRTPGEIGLKNAQKSYAELGMYAMQKSKGPDADPDKPVYVGPELGWPTAFGGHPEEFIELIEGAREKMAEDLTKVDLKNPNYNPLLTKEDALKIAKKHIRGDFDTSHLAMWFNHFEGKQGESQEKKLGRFNDWYLEQVDKMHEKDVIGSVQVVDAITGQHSHLPAGQGIFPVVDAVKRLKEKGWEGDIVSEGHEEEKFGDGRILTETWKAFGANVGSSYFGSGGSGPSTWRSVQGSYFGATQPPTYIVGGYVPSNEWSLWSEVPFE